MTKKIKLDSNGIKSALKKIQFTESTYYRSIAEYIWNGFDAGANKVELIYEISQADDKGHFTKLIIKDNGSGIDQNYLDEKFKPVFDTEKIDKNTPIQNQSAIHGKLGVGRLTFFTFANFASWDTTFLRNNEKYNFTIEIESSKLDLFSGDEKKAEKVRRETGTMVTFDGFNTLKGKKNIEYELISYLKKEFGWFLELNKNNNFIILLNNEVLDYDSIIGDKDEQKIIHEESGIEFDIRFVRWNEQLNKEFSRFYYINDNKIERWKETTKLNNQGDGFYHSVFIESSYFNHFNFDSHEDSIQKSLHGGVRSDSEFKYLMKKIYIFLRRKRKPFLKKHSEKVYKDYEEKGIIDFDKNDPVQVIRKNELEKVFKEIYEIQPRIFRKLKNDQKKIFIGLLKLLLNSDERENLISIIGDIIELDTNERRELKKILEDHDLHKIIKTMELITDRFKIVEILKQLVFKKEINANERDHLQKVVEDNFWIFGEQYHLVSKDESFQKSLEKYVYILNGEKKSVDYSGNKRKRMDIFLCQRWKNTDSIKNVIIELKSPKIKELSNVEYYQVNEYKNMIKKEPEFNSSLANWEFILVGQSYDTFIEDLIKTNVGHGEKNLVSKVENFKVYVKTWSQIFDEFEISHEWLNRKLEVQKNLLIGEVADADEAVKIALEKSEIVN